jgi:hypothetical protein
VYSAGKYKQISIGSQNLWNKILRAIFVVFKNLFVHLPRKLKKLATYLEK